MTLLYIQVFPEWSEICLSFSVWNRCLFFRSHSFHFDSILLRMCLDNSNVGIWIEIKIEMIKTSRNVVAMYGVDSEAIEMCFFQINTKELNPCFVQTGQPNPYRARSLLNKLQGSHICMQSIHSISLSVLGVFVLYSMLCYLAVVGKKMYFLWKNRQKSTELPLTNQPEIFWSLHVAEFYFLQNLI